MSRALGVVVAAALLTACGSNSSSSCDRAAQTGCAAGLVCEPVQGGNPACFKAVAITGTVADLESGTPLNDARVVALDANGAPQSTAGITAGTTNSGTPTGAYALAVRAARDSTGKPVQAFVTLRADKQSYQRFPGGVRTALPIDLSTAALDQATNTWGISSQLTALELVPLSSAVAAFVHGSVARPPSEAGVLVVAEPAPGGAGPTTGSTGIADASGNYAIFNLAPGTAYVVTAYAKGANYTPVTTAALASGDNALAQITLETTAPAQNVGGNLIYNNGATSPVSVTLVVESTYVSSLDRGESVPGLTVSGSASYSLSGVPDGRYIVLAAFEADGDVRDVSGTGNTAPVEMVIQNGALSGGAASVAPFKIVPAVQLLSIGGTSVSTTPAVVTTPSPTFAWQKESVDASAATYRVNVYDTFGTNIWTHDVLAGAGVNSLAYGGTALQAGMSYQLRILAIKEASPGATGFTELSQTEDLLGVFTYHP
jgi:hypothetical protein